MKKLPPLTPLLALALAAAAGCDSGPRGTVVTISASRVGAEGEVLREQMARFQRENPDIHIEFQDTPDASDLRHQLYAQYLNARTGDPDVLQLDVVWTPEFAGAGWVLRLDERFAIDKEDFFPATIEANQWRGGLYGLPWFADVGMLYYRTDLADANAAPETFDELTRRAKEAKQRRGLEFGLLWQGARYEGLVCVFLEHLGGFGGRIMDERGRVVVDSEAAVKALSYMRASIYEDRIVPEVALTWQEELTLRQFKLGSSAFLRSWPYAARELSGPESAVAGKFAVALMPAAPSGEHTATLGGSQLAINANTEHPEAAFKVIAYLTHPDRMLERARQTGQFPTRKSVYDRPALADALLVPPATARRLIEQARPRPVTPVYTELSGVLQVWLHRALVPDTDISPRAALESAGNEMRALLRKYELYEE